MIHAVASIERGTYNVWQAELLAYSWRRAGINDPLTFLCAGGEVDIEGAESVAVRNHSYGEDNLPPNAGYYPPWNKPFGLLEWLQSTNPASESVLILDPDMVAVEQIGQIRAVRGRPLAEGPWWWMGPSLTDPAIRARSRNPDLVASVGVPMLIHADDLREVIPGWLRKIHELRVDAAAGRPGVPADPWVAEMTGYVLAAADLGLEHRLHRFTCRPLIHYFGAPPSAFCLSPYPWSKYDYQPWSEPPRVGADMPPQVWEFREILAEYAGIRRAGTEQAPVNLWPTGTPE